MLVADSRTYHVWGGHSVLAEYAEGSGPGLRWARERIYLGGRLLANVEPGREGADAIRLHHPGRLHARLVTGPGANEAIGNNVLPFGTSIGAGAPPTDNPFTSYHRGTAAPLDYAINRFYDPSLGRFTQPDPLGVMANSPAGSLANASYVYAGNDPVNLIDPLGLVPRRICSSGTVYADAVGSLGVGLDLRTRPRSS